MDNLVKMGHLQNIQSTETPIETGNLQSYDEQSIGLHVQFITYDFIQTCLFISHRLEIYTMTWREYKRIGRTTRLV